MLWREPNRLLGEGKGESGWPLAGMSDCRREEPTGERRRVVGLAARERERTLAICRTGVGRTNGVKAVMLIVTTDGGERTKRYVQMMRKRPHDGRRYKRKKMSVDHARSCGVHSTRHSPSKACSPPPSATQKSDQYRPRRPAASAAVD